ncbi:MAG TPA: T9SS type A sorting domain-containing protein [Flavobacterium sp.]|nr:T9SS type A sorting domain-containing protein [Flavobacterium sp.]
MKKLLLFAFLGVFAVGNSQVVVERATLGPLPGWNFNTLQASNTLTGTLTSVQIQGTLTASVAETYADDLTIYITPTSALALGGLLQVGGFSDLQTPQRYGWTNGASDEVGTVVSGTVTLTTPINFTGQAYQIWIGNGYGGEGTSGTWADITVTLNGVSEIQHTPPANCVATASISPANGATNIDPAAVMLSWGAPAGSDYTGYNIYLGDTLESLELAATNFQGTSAGPLDWSDMPGETIYWKVVPVNVNAEAVGCDEVWSFTLAGEMNTSDFFSNNLSIYPNPANDFFSISSTTSVIENVKITDLNGRVVKSIAANGVSDIQVNISDLTTGMYFVTVETDNGTGSTKLVKK